MSRWNEPFDPDLARKFDDIGREVMKQHTRAENAVKAAGYEVGTIIHHPHHGELKLVRISVHLSDHSGSVFVMARGHKRLKDGSWGKQHLDAGNPVRHEIIGHEGLG